MYKPIFNTKQNGVPILSKNEIETIGEKFVRDFFPSMLEHPQALDIEAFAELRLGLEIDYKYLSDDHRYLGMMVFNDTNKVIIFDDEKRCAEYLSVSAGTIIIDNSLLEDNQEHRFRFTMAHECGHSVLHSTYYCYNPNQMTFLEGNSKEPMVQCRDSCISARTKPRRSWSDSDWMEWQANYFASVVLMPAQSIKNFKFSRVEDDIPNEIAMIQKVAQTYNVSPQAAKYRLEELGYLKSSLLDSNLSFLNYKIQILPE